MKSLYTLIEGILSTDDQIKAKSGYEVFLTDIVQELKLNFDIDCSAYPNSTGKSTLPFARIRNFDGFQYKKALDKFNIHLDAITSELKRKGIKTEVKLHSSDQAFGYSISTIQDYKIVFSKIRKRDIKLDFDITLMFNGEYKPANNTTLKLVTINISSPNAEIKEMLR